jgi:predicted nucleic acid-binding protein
MAGNSRYTAVLDACVLYQLAIADSLMSIAVTGLFAAKWTQKIEEEWIESLEKNRPDLKGKLATRRDSMREAVPDWEISEAAWNSIASSLTLPDPNDVHVLAAAIAGHADCIVTRNQRDFPASIMDVHGIDILDPDEFIINQWDLENVPVMAAFKGMRARRKKPTESVEDFALTLEKNGLPATAQKIREAAALI